MTPSERHGEHDELRTALERLASVVETTANGTDAADYLRHDLVDVYRAQRHARQRAYERGLADGLRAGEELGLQDARDEAGLMRTSRTSWLLFSVAVLLSVLFCLAVYP